MGRPKKQEQQQEQDEATFTDNSIVEALGGGGEAIPEKVVEIIEGPRFIQPSQDAVEGESTAEKLIFYLKSRPDGFVKISEFLRLEHKYQSGHQDVNKGIKQMLSKLVFEGKILVRDSAHLSLGTFFHNGETPKTQYITVENTVIEAKLLA